MGGLSRRGRPAAVCCVLCAVCCVLPPAAERTIHEPEERREVENLEQHGDMQHYQEARQRRPRGVPPQVAERGSIYEWGPLCQLLAREFAYKIQTDLEAGAAWRHLVVLAYAIAVHWMVLIAVHSMVLQQSP